MGGEPRCRSGSGRGRLMTIALFMVCEAQADYWTGAGLVDRVICDRVDWIDAEVIDDYREWCGGDDSCPFLKWTEVNALADVTGSFGASALGHFAGQPGAAYAAKARRTLLLIQALPREVHGIVLLIDDDGDPD